MPPASGSAASDIIRGAPLAVGVLTPRRGGLDFLRFLFAARRAANEEIGIDLEQPHRGQVLASLHVVDTPDQQVSRGPVDVEQLRSGGHFADPVDELAIDAGDLRAWQALLEERRDGLVSLARRVERIWHRALGASSAGICPNQRAAAAEHDRGERHQDLAKAGPVKFQWFQLHCTLLIR
jgi:hypothetical protein